jgi:hypothetical protein
MNISDEAVEAAVSVFPWRAAKYFDENAMRATLEAALPHLLSHDAMVNRETKREELAQAWERGREDGYHHRPNPYRSAGWSE